MIALKHAKFNKTTGLLFILVLIQLFSMVIGALPNSPTPVYAQDVLTEEDIPKPDILVKITYDFNTTGDPEDFDDLVFPIFLLNASGEIKYQSFAKINVGDSKVDEQTFSDTAFGAFFDIDESGIYQACAPTAAPPVNITEYHCSELFSHSVGSLSTVSLDSSPNQTFVLIEAALAYGINEKPCPGVQIGWVICPMVEQIFETLEFLYTKVFKGILVIAPLDDSAEEGSATAAVYDIWNSFRILANVLFILIFLVAIFGQGFAGFRIFSAYNFKKMMPRLVIGIIGVQLSWYAAGFMIDVFNVLGAGIRGLILAPVEGLDVVEFDVSGIFDHVTVFVATAGLVSLFGFVGGIMGIIMILVPLFLSIFLAIIFGIFVLLLRNVAILLGIILSPLAFVLWILPNTSNFFQFWWNNMWRLLIMYPLILGLLGVGELAAKIIVAGNEGSLLWSIIGMSVLFAPFFAIPYTFRVAQNILGSVTTGLDGQRKLIGERVFGAPDIEGTYLNRRRNRRNRYRTQNRWKRDVKHFVNTGQQIGVGGGKRGIFGKKKWNKCQDLLETRISDKCRCWIRFRSKEIWLR